jgi:hypothetical protein
MTNATSHCHRPWWKRPPVWFLGVAAVLLIVVAVFEQTNKPALTPYSTFLDQLDAGNVAGVTFQGTEIDGRFKHGLGNSSAGGAAPSLSFRSRVPDFGDPALIPELHKQHVVIEIATPSAWAWLLGRVPWPMLIFVGAMLVAALVRLVRGGNVQSGSGASVNPQQGMVGLISGLFTKERRAQSPAPHEGVEPKSG